MSIEDTLQEEITSELSRRKYVNNDEGKAQMIEDVTSIVKPYLPSPTVEVEIDFDEGNYNISIKVDV